MRVRVQRAVRQSLGEELVALRELHGGCINAAYACQLQSGRQVFLKYNQAGDPRIFEVEARGLAWLAQAGALRVPELIAVASDHLLLEYITPARPHPRFDEELGRGLARVHASGSPGFGWGESGFLATLAQDNHAEVSWPVFYVERRLRPLWQLARTRGLAPQSWDEKFERLFAKMDQLVGDAEAPARLHGDLWSGNLHCDEAGQPVLIDPACYGGHREIDLAMLCLFGTPSESFFGAYREQWPLQSEFETRMPLYQLYPLLAHLLLFGSSYASQCQRALETYL